MHMEYLLNGIYLQKIYPASFRETHLLADLAPTDIQLQPQPNHPKVTGVMSFYHALPRSQAQVSVNEDVCKLAAFLAWWQN